MVSATNSNFSNRDQPSRDTVTEPSRQLEVPRPTTRVRVALASIPRRRRAQLREVGSLEPSDVLDGESSTMTNLKRKRDEG